MTAKQLFDDVLSLMFCPANEADEYEAAFLRLLNMRIRECAGTNAALREYKGKEPLVQEPVSDLSQELIFEEELLIALPYGIASILHAEEDATGIANVYRSDYAAMLADCGRTFETDAEGE